MFRKSEASRSVVMAMEKDPDFEGVLGRFFHEAMDKAAAEAMLQDVGQGLIRCSNTDNGYYLSYKNSAGNFKHALLSKENRLRICHFSYYTDKDSLEGMEIVIQYLNRHIVFDDSLTTLLQYSPQPEVCVGLRRG